MLAPGYRDRAVAALRAVPQPFSLSEARKALGTSRRVAVPLLEALDASGSRCANPTTGGGCGESPA